MCLSIPARVIVVDERPGALRQAVVDLGDRRAEVCLAYTPQARVGDWVQVHAGFAVRVLDHREARRTRALIDDLADGVEGDDR